MDELLTKSADAGVTLSTDESAEYDRLEGECKSLDQHIARLAAREGEAVAKAVRVEGVVDSASATRIRDRQPISVKSMQPKGYAFTKFAMAVAKSKGNLMQAEQIAKGFDDVPEVAKVLKAAVDFGTTTDSEWAAPLVEYTTMQNEFIELLRPETILGKMDGFRRVPFNSRLVGQKSGSSVQWVGEGKQKPVSALAFDAKQLGFKKLAGIVVVSDELVKFSNPQIVGIVQSDMIATIATFLDDAFLNPAYAGSDTAPASITNGVTPIAASGTSADDLKRDVQAVFASFLAANQSVAGAYWVMSATQALAISMFQNALGNAEFPGLTMNGGTLFGLPVVVSEAPVTQGRIVLVKTNEVLLAEEGIVVDSSSEATINMSSDPENEAEPVLVNLWQNNLLGIRAERFINWGKRRNNAVAVITGANYGAIGE